MFRVFLKISSSRPLLLVNKRPPLLRRKLSMTTATLIYSTSLPSKAGRALEAALLPAPRLLPL